MKENEIKDIRKYFGTGKDNRKEKNRDMLISI
jgi:hypothetical protein